MNKNLIININNILQLYPDNEKKQLYLKKISKYNNECGCSMGAKFFIVSIFVCFVHSFFFLIVNWNKLIIQIPLYLLFTLLFTILGKLIGLGIAKFKLYRIYKFLVRNKY